MTTDPTRRAIETVLTVRDRMQAIAEDHVTDLVGDIVDATVSTGIDRADRWSMAVHSVVVVAARLLSQQEPKR